MKAILRRWTDDRHVSYTTEPVTILGFAEGSWDIFGRAVVKDEIRRDILAIVAHDVDGALERVRLHDLTYVAEEGK